jgi:general secretion pathway protein M
MNPALTARAALLRQSLAALGYVAAVLVLLVLAYTAVAGIFEQRASVAASADLLAQLEGRRAAVSKPGEVPPSAIPTGSPFLEGQTLTVAGAALLQRVADAVTKVGGSVLSSQVDVQGVQAKDGYVSVLASCEVEQAAMQRLLYDLEAGMPYLFIEQFVAQAPQASQAAPAVQAQGSGRMRVLLAVAGRWEGGK